MRTAILQCDKCGKRQRSGSHSIWPLFRNLIEAVKAAVPDVDTIALNRYVERSDKVLYASDLISVFKSYLGEDVR